MSPSITGPDTRPARSNKKLLAATCVFALAGLMAFGFSARKAHQRYQLEHPPPLPDVVAPLLPEQQKMVTQGMPLLGKALLKLDPDKQKKLEEIWKTTPRSVAEAIDYQRRTDALLTPEQKALLDPIRKKFQERTIDRMMAPASKRFTPEDFEKFKKEIKARVESRINGH